MDPSMKEGQDGTPAPSDDTRNRIAISENDPSDLMRIPEFGLWNPNIKEAAELVVVDMWFSGAIAGINEPEDFDGDAKAPWLKEALADTVAAFEARLSSAIESGKLKTSIIRRGSDDRVIPKETHISYDDLASLVEWMVERSLYPGDYMADWEDTESKIAELICDEVAFLRNACMSGGKELGSKRRKCRAFEFYCFRCRDVREAYLGIADVAIESLSRLRVKALCAVCSTPINKVQNVRELGKIQTYFHVQQLTGEHVIERPSPSLNSDLET